MLNKKAIAPHSCARLKFKIIQCHHANEDLLQIFVRTDINIVHAAYSFVVMTSACVRACVRACLHVAKYPFSD
jgi:hypothetical protein